MKRWLSMMMVLVSGVQTAWGAEGRVVLIVTDDAPKFEVIYHRASNNAAGAAIGGLIGAGIQHSIESEKDAKKREAMSSHVSARAWDDVYVKSLNEALIAKGFEPRWATGKAEPKDAVADVYVMLYPSTYGYRVIDTSTFVMAAYVEFDAIYSREPIQSRKKRDKESFYLTGKKQASYEDHVEDAAALNAEVEAVLAQGARRLANKIIYNLK